jgi:hypothetical protein
VPFESFEDRLNGADPPDAIDALDLDLFTETHAFLRSEPLGPAMQLHWHRPDGEVLHYYRWADEDGERYYTEGALRDKGVLA